MADSRRHTNATAQIPGRDNSSPNQNTQFDIQLDDEVPTEYAPNHAKRRVGTPDTMTYDEAEAEARRGQHDQQYEGGQHDPQYGQPQPQYGSTNLHAHPAPNSSESDPLRYPLARYIPPEKYYDCDQFYLVMHAGVGDKYSNCFGCGRPKTEEPESNPSHCAGFPLCPKWVLCNFCSQPCGTHHKQYCPKLWATSSFLNRYSSWDVRTGFPDNLQVKPNTVEAEHLQQSGYLAITPYTNSIDQQKTLYRWLIPERATKNPIRDFGAMNQSQRNRHHKQAKRAHNPGFNQTSRKQWAPKPTAQAQNSSSILMPGTKRKSGPNAQLPNGFAGVGGVRPSDDDPRKRMKAHAYGTEGTQQSDSLGGVRQAVRPQFATHQNEGDAADRRLTRPQFATHQDDGDAAGLDLTRNEPVFDGISIRGAANRPHTFHGSPDTSMSRGGGRGRGRGGGRVRGRGQGGN
ncbi:hypothetical protein HBI64_038810 [Parastagonospora nodorum]|nr:hypothetical protein HBH71_079960 [Parastagonospora nodorum]KAH5544737.1 hypothetical protein HBI27_060600 [Parastagonospora nodorum]KAH6138708.1 hypothetical protein HBI64_038810 [Parastagonospora nodorum]